MKEMFSISFISKKILAVFSTFLVLSSVALSQIPTLNLQLWLKSDAGITLNGSTVSNWADQSGNGNNAIQNNSDRQPLLVNNGLNGKPILRFDGLNDKLGLTGSTPMTQITLFMVVKNNAPVPGQDHSDHVMAFGAPTGEGYFVLFGGSERISDRIEIGGPAGGVRAKATNIAAYGEWRIISIVTNTTIHNTTLRWNGSNAVMTPLDSDNAISVPMGTGGGIGGADNSPFGYLLTAHCDFAEAIVYNRVVNDSERNAIEDYLASKYNISNIIPAGSMVKKLSTNQYVFTEGPVWYNDSALLFVDDNLPGSGPDIYQYEPISKQFSKWPAGSTHCTGLSCDKEGNLIGASSNIIMVDKAGQISKTLASGYNGKIFDNPNDLISDNKGGVYFSDPDFFLTNPPQDKTAVYYIDPVGNIIRVIDDVAEPNGLVLSPDGTKLYVDDGNSKYLYSWDVAPDGTVSGKLSLAELQTVSGNVAEADGMAIDIKGNFYVATGIGIQVFSPQGDSIATIVVPEQPSNCDFGGSDFKTLYITARSNLYSIDLNYPGFAVSRVNLTSTEHLIPNQPVVEVYPNPFTEIATFEYQLENPEKVKLRLFDVSGRQVDILLNEQQLGGTHIINWDASGIPAGIYYYQLQTGNQVKTGKIILTR